MDKSTEINKLLKSLKKRMWTEFHGFIELEDIANLILEDRIKQRKKTKK